MRVRKWFVLVLLLAMIAGACGGDDDEDTAGGSDSESASASTADGSDSASASTADDDEDGADDGGSDDGGSDDGGSDGAAGPSGELRYGTPLAPATMDPHLEVRDFVLGYYAPIYDGLVNEQPDGSIVPGLATEWEVTDTEARFTLREGVTFHDGTPFDAEAVRYNIEKVQAAPGRNFGLLINIAAVEVVSPTEVVFQLNAVDRDLLLNLARFPGLMVSPGVAPEDVAAGTPAGTGPYMIVERTESDLVLEPYPDFYDPAQQTLERISWTQLTDDEARFNALVTGEVDVAPVRAFQLEDAESQGFEIARSNTQHSSLLFFDIGGNLVPEFADVRVRQAMAHLINRDGWGAAVTRGVGEPANQLFHGDSPWVVEGFDGFPYDPERAVELLQEAGVTDLTFETSSWGIFNLMNQTAAAMLAEGGITMTIRDVPPGGDITAVTAQEVGASATFVAGQHPDQIYQTYMFPPAPFNAWNVPVPSIDEQIGIAQASATEDDANAAYRDMLQEAYEQAWIVPIWQNQNIIGYNPDRFDIEAWEGVTIGIGIRGITPKS